MPTNPTPDRRPATPAPIRPAWPLTAAWGRALLHVARRRVLRARRLRRVLEATG